MRPSDKDLFELNKSIDGLQEMIGHSRPRVKAEDFERVVVVMGSSRSGSSLLFQLLSASNSFWAPFGEETPAFRAAGVGWVNSTSESDFVASISPQAEERIRQSLFLDLGLGTGSFNPSVAEQYARRLLWQNPKLHSSVDKLVSGIRENQDWKNLISRFGMNINLYDLTDAGVDRNRQVELPPWIIEEPPLVVPKPRTLPQPNDLKTRPVLIKTSTHAYRIPVLKKLFPKARFSFVILTRNPAASINGMMDGWLSNSFHSHNFADFQKLDIKGYSSQISGGNSWWKFDLPPGWTDFTQAPLQDVCAFQWRSAYSSILKNSQATGDQTLMVKHESLVNPQLSRKEFSRVFEFLGIAQEAPVNAVDAPPVMASVPPAAGRWRARQTLIAPILTRPEIRDLAERMNYDLEKFESLT